MTTTRELLASLRQQLIRLWLDGDSLAFEAPTGAMRPEFRREIRKRKDEIVQYLRRARGMVQSDDQPIVPVPRDTPQPLSFAQLRMWILHRLEAGAAYNVPLTGRLLGRLDARALHAAFTEIVRRHESLRTTFRETADGPVQLIASEPTLPFEEADLSHLAPGDREIEVARRTREAVLEEFDLENGPLLRVDLLRLADDEHVLLARLHHIIADGWSMGVMFRELCALYDAFSRNRPSPLPEPSVQYVDFSAWQRQRGDLFARQLDYWREQLAGVQTLELPLDHTRAAQQSFDGDRVEFQLPPRLAQQLGALGRGEDATPFMTIMAAFTILLARLSGQRDIVVGTPIANRNRAEIEDLIGFLVNSLAIRTTLIGDPTFRDVLRQVRDSAMAAFQNQDVPFEEIVKELHVQRDLARNPVFQVMFSMQNAPFAEIRLGDVSLEPLHADVYAARFDLDLHVWENDEGGYVMSLLYAKDLFEASTAVRILRQLMMVIEGVIADPDAPVYELPILPSDDRERLVLEYNATDATYPHQQTLHGLVEEQVRKSPDAPAISFESTTLTYRELDERADRLARQLRDRGIGCGTLVALCVERSPVMVVAMLGILKAGAAYVPLDPAHPAARLEMILEEARVRFVLSERALVEPLGLEHSGLERRGDGTARELLLLDDEDAAVPVTDSGTLEGGAGPAELAYVIFTSGSTGRPKGVQIEHRAVVNFLCSMAAEPGVSQADVLLAVTTISFDIAALEIFTPLVTGARVVIAPQEVVADGQRLRDLLGTGITVMQATPATWQLLLHAGWAGTTGLKILCGGEALPRALAGELLGRGDELWNMYGPTETTIWSAVARVRSADDPISIGRPIANTQLYVVDPRLQPVPPGVVGELIIGGDGVARGYLGRPELTAEQFVPDAIGRTSGQRLYRTGDLARFDAAGRLICLGRRDHQVKLRGYRIELGEIEAALHEHAVVDEAAVALWAASGSDPRLAAYVVPRAEATSAGESDQVERWQSIWGEAYGTDAAVGEPTFNIAGWNSSYTGAPIPAAEMAEWLEGTVGRIQATEPRRVLEIGCGTGMFLYRVAADAEVYRATDISPTAIDYVSRQLPSALGPRADRVTLEQRAADDFDGIPRAGFDTVILNSVAQYLPSIPYLLRVIEGAAAAVAPGGRLFLGDLRNHALLDAYLVSVEAFRAADDTRTGELHELIARQRAMQEELLIDPQLCSALLDHLPGAERVEIRPKRGRAHNELTKFRYDAIVHFAGEAPAPPEFDGPWLDWAGADLDLDALRDQLVSSQPAVLGVRGIPNARTALDAAIAATLADGDPELRLAAVREQVTQATAGVGIEPEDLWALGAELPYGVELSWLRTDDQGRFDALLVRHDVAEAPVFPHPRVPARRWAAYGNAPMQDKLSRALAPGLTEHLAERLPEYMIPSTFVVMEALPLNPNGKIDRRELPDPDWRRTQSSGAYAAPSTPTEVRLAAMWAELLAIERVGARDDFFDLGGHSILATQMLGRVREAFGIELPLTKLFLAPTIAAFAEQLDTHEWALRSAARPASDDLEEIEI